MFGHIAAQRYVITQSINQLVYDINFTTLNNQLNFRSLVGRIWYLYSNMPVGAAGYDFYYDFGPYLCEGDRFDEMKIKVA